MVHSNTNLDWSEAEKIQFLLYKSDAYWWHSTDI